MGEEGVWGPELAELRRREAFAELMGGEEKVARQHDRGKLDVRQRIGRLLDTGSFHEIGKIAGTPTYDADGELVDLRASNFVFGRGLVDGRTVVVAADDFTVRGGAADASIIAKQIAAEQMALELRLPIVRLIDGTGGGGSVKTLDTKADEKGSNIVGSSGRGSRTYVPFNPAWDLVVSNLATVPTVALCLGPVAGLGAARAVTSHYSVMVRGLSQLFVAGPPVVNRLGSTFLCSFLLHDRPEFRVGRNRRNRLSFQQGPHVLSGAPGNDGKLSSGRDFSGGALGQWQERTKSEML